MLFVPTEWVRSLGGYSIRLFQTLGAGSCFNALSCMVHISLWVFSPSLRGTQVLDSLFNSCNSALFISLSLSLLHHPC